MTQYLVAIHHPDDYDPAVAEDAAMHLEINALNGKMRAAGIIVFLGGLAPVRESKALRRQGGGFMLTDGPYTEAKEHIGGFWVLELPDVETALGWAREAALVCRAPVEVRPFN